MFDYSYQPSKEHIVVGLFFAEEGLQRRSLRAQAFAVGEAYGLTVFMDEEPSSLVPADQRVMDHAIYVFDVPFREELVQLVTLTLSKEKTASIAFAYPSQQSMLEAVPRIDHYKNAYNDRLNFLRPDEAVEGGFQVSAQKLLDNMVCDSVRVKFKADRRSISTDHYISQEEIKFFEAASRFYERHSMYHRSECDGYFAVRLHNGFAITATKTSKVKLDVNRLAVVHGYDEATNTLSYSGKYLPSSDSVEAAVIVANLQDVRFLFHTHASEYFTRNVAFQDRVLVPRLPYGEAELGRAVVAALQKVSDGFVIMEEHGEVFASGVTDHRVFFSELDKLCYGVPVE